MSLSNITHPLLQAIKLDGVPIDPNASMEFTYIEAADLSAPAIIIKLRDEFGEIRDNLGLKVGSILECEIASAHDEESYSFTETFSVSVFPFSDGTVNIEALQVNCFELKQPASKPKFFVDKSPKQILQLLAPKLKVNCSVVKGSETYHLNTGTSPSKLLRKMARDHGAACWIARGVIHFHTYKSISKRTGTRLFSLSGNESHTHIDGYSVIGNQYHYDRVMKKSWMAQSLDEGLVKADENQDKEMVMLPQMARWQLNNQSTYLQPRIDIQSIGLIDLEPAMAANLELTKIGGDSEVDESIEGTMIVQQVSHHQTSLLYVMRVQLGVVNDGE